MADEIVPVDSHVTDVYGRVVLTLAISISILCGIISVFFFLTGAPLLFYLTIAVAGASIIYSTSKLTPSVSLPFFLTLRQVRVVQIGGFVGIGLLLILGRLFGPSLPEIYYISYITILGVVLVFASAKPDLVFLSQILLTSFVVRLTILQSAPVIGSDSTNHIGITGYVVSTGKLIPESISYYRNFPAAHIEGATLSVITGLGPKMGFFLPIAIGSLTSLLFVYIIATRFVRNGTGKWAGIVAITIAVTSWPFLAMTATPIAQAMNFTFLPMILYLLIQQPDIKKDLLLITLLFTLSFVHVLAPYLLTGLILISSFIHWIFTQLGTYPQSRAPARDSHNLIIIGLLLFVHVIQYHIYTQVFGLQFNRILSIFLTSRSLSQEVSQGDILNAVILVETKPILLFAGSLLVIGIFVVIAGYYLLENIELSSVDYIIGKWTIIGALLLGGAGIIHFVSTGININRGFVAATIIASPVVIVASDSIRQETENIGTAIIIMLVVTGVFLGIGNPQVAIPERTTGSQPMLLQSEVAAIEFVNTNKVSSKSEPLVSYKSSHLQQSKGSLKSNIDIYSPDKSGKTNLTRYASKNPKTPYIVRINSNSISGSTNTRYQTLYSSGSTKIILPV